jgi:hypothetical protein
MNIFAVNNDPRLAACDLPDKLIVKMPTESLQLLTPWAFNTHGVYIQKPDGTNYGIKGFAHHPCSKWLYIDPANAAWVISHGLAMCFEYSRRYGDKTHGSQLGLLQVRKLFIHKHPGVLPSQHTEFVQAMPDEFKVPGDPVTAYRNYINGYKGYAEWRYSEKPGWWDEAKHEPVRKQYLAEREAKRMLKKNVNSRVPATLQNQREL